MISAVILTKNEEKNIEACLKTLLWCDEIILIDDNSSDTTVAIAQKLGAKVYVRALSNDFASQRNFGLEKARGDWIFFTDADERVSESLAFEIQTKLTMQLNHALGYFVKRMDTMWGHQLRFGETGNTRLLRLGRKNAGMWQGEVHERWSMQGNVADLQNPLLHFPHQTLTEFLQEINFYTDIRAKELFVQKITVDWWEIILYPKVKFIVNYFIKLGLLDGIPGLLVALLMSFHSFLVRGKLWILWHKK